MGEKTGGLTNMIIALVALVAIILIVQVAFPDMTTSITNGMRDIIDGSIEQIGTIVAFLRY
ncbi:hypothetical protein WMZ97_16640 [Lentibacillus sp. N15]|uniref:hypothetical protein n=1 Tax=Lentibacillus songyuanensis TaxID=3136161 RepID=UPI0031BA715F